MPAASAERLPPACAADVPPVLRLPVEVQLDILACLPLPERLVWARETCSSLRTLSDSLGRRLICPPTTVRARNRTLLSGSRLSLADLYAAALIVHQTPALMASASASASGATERPATPPRGNDPQPSSDGLPTPPPESVENAWYVLSPRRQKERAVAHAAAAAQAAASRLRIAVDHPGLGSGPGSDACLFLRAVRMLLDREYSTRQLRLTQLGMGKPDAGLPTSLFLVGWHGIPGDVLREMLIHEPTLSRVTTIVKTDQHDGEDVWSTFPAVYARAHCTQPPLGSDRYTHFAQRLCSSQRGYYEDAYNLGSPTRSAMPSPPSPRPDRRAEHEPACRHTQAAVAIGSRDPPFFVKGAGLSAGYDCICFNLPLSEEAGVPKPALQHIILQGRYHLQSSQELATMFDWSDTTCTGCRKPIFV